MDATGIALRLLGALLALGSLAGLRRLAMDVLLDDALMALTLPGARDVRAGRWRTRWTAASLVLLGLAGIALALLLAAAAWLFLLLAMAHCGYRLVVAPRFLDPWDPPDPPDPAGQAAGRRGFLFTLAIAAVAMLGWWHGVLLPLGDAPGWTLALGALLCTALLVFAARQWRRGRLSPGTPASVFDIPPRSSGLLLMPSWQDGALFDAVSGERLPEWESDTLLTADEFRAVKDWLALFATLADPDDPARCALKDPADLPRLEAAGRPVLDSLRARLGASAIDFAPAPRPRAPRPVRRLRVEARPGEEPVWCLDEDAPCPVRGGELGISWALDRALLAWAAERDEATDWDAEGYPPIWSPVERAAHAARGLELAARLARELAATGRAGVVVTAFGPDGEQARITPR